MLLRFLMAFGGFIIILDLSGIMQGRQLAADGKGDCCADQCYLERVRP